MDNQRVFGYARVSTQEQNLDRQIYSLKKYVLPENIVIDKASGKNFDRSGYQALKGALGLRNGDVLFITSLDRLSRNKSDIKHELEWFKQNKIKLRILDIPTSLISVPEGQEWIQEMTTNLLIEVLSSIAEQERITIRKRQREGIEAARRAHKHLGRPPKVIPDNFGLIYLEWKNQKMTAKKAMAVLSMSSSTFYRAVQQYEKKKSP